MSGREAARVCGICGASNALEAQVCGVCGRALPEAAPSAEAMVGASHAEESPLLDPALAAAPDAPAAEDEANSPPGEMEAAQAAAEMAQQKRCGWCGGLNPWVAVVCERCGARFPIPEQDAAYRRAAEERLRQAEADLDALRQRRRRRGWRRFL